MPIITHEDITNKTFCANVQSGSFHGESDKGISRPSKSLIWDSFRDRREWGLLISIASSLSFSSCTFLFRTVKSTLFSRSCKYQRSNSLKKTVIKIQISFYKLEFHSENFFTCSEIIAKLEFCGGQIFCTVLVLEFFRSYSKKLDLVL